MRNQFTEAESETPVRRPYHPPEVRLYGSLGCLTQSAGSANGDGGQSMFTKNAANTPAMSM